MSTSQLERVKDPRVLKELLQNGPLTWYTFLDMRPPGPLDQPPNKVSGIMDVGDIIMEDLSREQFPFSGVSMSGSKYWQKDLYIWVQPSHLLAMKSHIVLQAVEVYPPASNLRPEVQLRYQNELVKTGLKFEVASKPEKLELILVFPDKYKGSINRVIVLEFLAENRMNEFSCTTMRFKVGLLILGNLVSKAASNTNDRRLIENTTLSLEATPFVPFEHIVRFDLENIHCMPWSDPVALKAALPKPPNFQNSLNATVPFRFMDERLYHIYIESCRRNALHELALEYHLNHLNNVTGTESLLSVNPVTYLRTLGTLAIFEEMQIRLDGAKYDLNCVQVSFTVESDAYFTTVMKCKLHIPGSSESRPRVLVGDHIRFRPVKEDCDKFHIQWFEIVGVVTNYVLASEEAYCIIPIQKYCSMNMLNGMRYNLRFNYDHTSFSYVHYMLQSKVLLSQSFMDCLFPNQTVIDQLEQYRELRHNKIHHMKQTSLFRRECDSFNAEQERAIQNIVDWSNLDFPIGFKPPSIPPFIIFGPPGTGKTRTVIESILRIVEEYPNKRILACAPSDAAADVIALRLTKSLGNDKLLRLNWCQRMLSSVPAPLLSYTFQYGEMFELPDIDVLKKFQVVVATCVTAGALLPSFQSINFDVVIVDEASQATEAECMLPLALCKEGGLMALAGDIHQLGPTTKFPLFADCAPASSLQERLLKLPFYESCLPSASKLLSSLPTKLTLGVFLSKNYRSHKSILEVSSRLFYGGKLEPYADQQMVSRILAWDRFQAKHASAPMLFAAVEGKHEHEIDSPSFFNKAEIAKVVEICQSLVQAGLVLTSQIGVIAAFRKQVLKIRIALREVGLGAINVGSVEDFQGQEINAIVISTVMTSWIKQFSHKGSFGFINDAKKFNVSITRGMSFCAVVGHPEFLYLDPYWKQIIHQCIKNGSYEGNLPSTLSVEECDDTEDDFLFSSSIRSLMLDFVSAPELLM